MFSTESDNYFILFLIKSRAEEEKTFVKRS